MSIFSKTPSANSHSRTEAARQAFDAAPPTVSDTAPRAYSIADAIHLMRSLPVDQNVQLVVQVIRATLASMNVRVQDIVEDAVRREKAIEGEIASLHEKVTDLERQLEARREDVVGLEAELRETSDVKERLQLAEGMGQTGNLRSSAADELRTFP
jgi:hypothetical protein